MARSYVRTMLRQWAAGFAIPYYDTVAIEQAPADPIWCTFDFTFADTELADFCGGSIERGTATLVVMGPAGSGDAAVLAAAEAAAAFLMQQIDNSGALALFKAGAPQDFLEGPFYGVEIGIDYDYSF